MGPAGDLFTAIKEWGGRSGFWKALKLTETREKFSDYVRHFRAYRNTVKRYENKVAEARNALTSYEACIDLCTADPPEPVDGGAAQILTSLTPEDKFGPGGYDPDGTPEGEKQRWILAGQTLGYRVEFWNKPDAPVPTQDAVIEDTLDPAIYDLSTLEFTRVGFLQWHRHPEPGFRGIRLRR
jgi:hypothetical protein